MPENLFDLTGRTALVTGSSRGLGAGLASALLSAGAAVVLNGRDEERLGSAVEALSGEDARVFGYAFDVTDRAAVSAAVERIEKERGAIDVLVNNAGIHRRAPLDQMDDDAWHSVLETNLTGVFIVSQCVGRRMAARRAGKIINICSLMSEVGRPTIANYTAAKGGVKMLTKAMAVEWGPANVQVNGIGPGYFKTELTRALYEDPAFDEWLRRRTPAGRWGDPADLSGAVVFLASRASDYVNGQVLYVDGGLLASL